MIDATGAIRSGTQQISSASDDLSHRTEQQAANLEETAAALTQITETVRHSAEGAKHSREIVGAANFDALDGALVVKQAKEAMDAIAASSKQIGTIIGAIDEIAFQTNLLALNAGVEAARAGEAGRGFAVVASEVRGLAQRAAEAAKEIKNLVSQSATAVSSGVELVAKTGSVLERIIGQVSRINAVVTQIAAGASEQANAIQEVNEAINNMNRTTQQNATMVEESTAASHSLGKETSQLAELVRQFNVGNAISRTIVDDPKPMAPVVPKASISSPVRPASRGVKRTPSMGRSYGTPATAELQGRRLSSTPRFLAAGLRQSQRRRLAPHGFDAARH